MASYTRAELERRKESLTAQLKEVTDRLEKFDETIYKGKLEKCPQGGLSAQPPKRPGLVAGYFLLPRSPEQKSQK